MSAKEDKKDEAKGPVAKAPNKDIEEDKKEGPGPVAKAPNKDILKITQRYHIFLRSGDSRWIEAVSLEAAMAQAEKVVERFPGITPANTDDD